MALLLLFALVSCGNNDGGNGDDANAPAAKNYSVTYNGTRIEIGADAKTLLPKLGNPEGEVGEACGTDEKDVIYALSGIEIETHVKGDTEIVRQIKITNDLHKTEKGITIGSTKDDVVKAYGKDYKEGSSGAIRYEGDTSAIEFHFGVSGNVSNIYVKKK